MKKHQLKRKKKSSGQGIDKIQVEVSKQKKEIAKLEQIVFSKDVHIHNLTAIVSRKDQLARDLEEANILLQKRLDDETKARNAIEKSLSSRLGFAITFFFRWIYDKIFRKDNSINSLKKDSMESTLDTEEIKSDLVLDKELLSLAEERFGILNFHVDEATIVNGKICIRGWAFSSCGLAKLEFRTKSGKIGESITRINRPDVASSFPKIQESASSGFHFEVDHLDLSNKLVTIRFINLAGIFKDYQVKLEELTNLEEIGLNEQYSEFLVLNKPTSREIKKKKTSCSKFSYQPKISILTPVFNVDSIWLDRCIRSVMDQYYTNWELCIYDDCSTNEDTINSLKKWAEVDSRIKIRFGKLNLNISLATNEAAKMATGIFVGLLDHDDELSPDALYEVVKLLNKEKAVDLIYSDEDKINEEGKLSNPHFKPDFSIDLLRSQNYICHFTVVRKSIGDDLKWMRAGVEGAQDHDFVLRIAEKTDQIFHIPKVLYHWRMISGSTASDYSEKTYVYQAGKKAILDHLKRRGVAARVEKGPWGGTFQVVREIISFDLVSIVIPFKDNVELLRQCLDSIISKTNYPNYEILLVSNNSKDPLTFQYLEKVSAKSNKIKYFEYNIPFNYSKINNWAVNRAEGKYILLLNNDIEVITSNWLSRMVEHIQRDEVGAVGAKLLYKDKTVQHAGVILGIGGVAGHGHKYISDSDPGYFSRACLIQNLTACTAACLLVKKDVFLNLNGLDEHNFKIAFNDIDLCMKIRQAGFLIVYTPYAKLFHYESKSRGPEDTPEKRARFNQEVEKFQQIWSDLLSKGDPYFNPNFSLKNEKFTLNLKQRINS